MKLATTNKRSGVGRPDGARSILLGVVILAGLFLTPAWADTIHLKDHRAVIGIIDTAASDEKAVAIRTAAGVIRVPRTKIDRIDQQAAGSYTEANGDIAVAQNKPERALELYEKALANRPGDPGLLKKIENLRKKMRVRERQSFGAMFEDVERAIKEGKFEEASRQADAMMRRLRDEAARKRCQALDAQAHIGMARHHLEYINYPEAERNYNQAIEADPQSPTPRLELGDMLQSSPARKGASRRLYEKGIELAKAHPGVVGENQLLEYLYKLAQIYLNERDFSKAADTFLEVTREDRNSHFPGAVDYAVEAYAKIPPAELNANLNKIIDNLKSILTIKPAGIQAYALLGRIYFDRKEWTNAREMLSVAAQKAPTGDLDLATAQTAYYLGISYRRLGQTDQAAEAFQRLILQRTGNYDALCELGDIRLEQANYDEALRLFDEALGLDRGKYRAYLGKGMTLQRKQPPDYAQARENFNEVVRRDAENAQAQMAIARSYFQEEKWADADSESQKTIKLIEEKGQDKGPKKSAEEAGKGVKESRTDYRGEEKRILAEAWTITGRANVAQNRSNQARENLDKALKFVPNYAPALEAMGQSYRLDKLNKEAEEFFVKAIRADPKNPNYYLSLGIFWHQDCKNTAKALPYYMKYFELGGKDAKVATWIKECNGTPPKI